MPKGIYKRKSRKQRKQKQSRTKVVDKWTTLLDLVQDYADAQQADSWKGGGDPEAIPVIEAELVLARAKLMTYVAQLRREEE